MEDMEEMQDNKTQLKMPKDLMGESEEEVDYDHEIDDYDQEQEEESKVPDQAEDQEADEDIENEVFAMARENQEMKNPSSFANQEMMEKINKIEDEMMEDKKWQLKGEIKCKDRNYNSLLEEYVDFDTATKLPPEITKETTN